MRIQKCRRLERDRQTPTPLRPNPKGTESSDQAIQDAEIWRTPARAIEDQQLMFGENGWRVIPTHSYAAEYFNFRQNRNRAAANQTAFSSERTSRDARVAKSRTDEAPTSRRRLRRALNCSEHLDSRSRRDRTPLFWSHGLFRSDVDAGSQKF
jgi:hypothetical protein